MALLAFECPDRTSHDTVLIHHTAPIGARQALGQLAVPCPACGTKMEPSVMGE